jgi:hypothetical protein
MTRDAGESTQEIVRYLEILNSCLYPMDAILPKLAFSDSAFMRTDLRGFLTGTLRKSEKRDAVTAVRELRNRGYPVLGFECVDRSDTLDELRTILPGDVLPVSIHGPIFPNLGALRTNFLDAPSLFYAQEVLAEYAVSGTFRGRTGFVDPIEHISRLEQIAAFYSTDQHRVPITLHPHCVQVLGEYQVFPRPAGSPDWAIEPDFPRPNQRRSQALISDLQRVIELAHTYGCSINFDTSHLRLSGGDLIKSWEMIHENHLRVQVMHLVGSGRDAQQGRMIGGMELSGQSLSPRDLREYAEFFHFIRDLEGWNGLVVIEISGTRISGSTSARIDAIRRTLDFYLGDYDAFLCPASFSFPNPLTIGYPAGTAD